MATESHNETQTVEPSIPQGPGSAAVTRLTLSQRLAARRFGRVILAGMQWSVVFALVGSGYVAAGAISTGLRQAAPAAAGPQPMLAASPAAR